MRKVSRVYQLSDFDHAPDRLRMVTEEDVAYFAYLGGANLVLIEYGDQPYDMIVHVSPKSCVELVNKWIQERRHLGMNIEVKGYS